MPTPAALPTPPLPESIAEGPNWVWQLARSLLFWLILTGLFGYSLYYFLGERLKLFRFLPFKRVFAWLKQMIVSLRKGTRRAFRLVREAIVERLAQRQRRLEQGTGRFLSLRGLRPRDKVRYFYLSILYRGARQGFKRPDGTTPLEFERLLAKEMPELADDLEQLTNAFLEARYSEHEITSEHANLIQIIWRRLKQWFSTRRRTQRAQTERAPGDDDA